MLAVEWWDLDPSDPESRTYKKWVPPGGSPRQHVLLLLNSTELRAIDFSLYYEACNASCQPAAATGTQAAKPQIKAGLCIAEAGRGTGAGCCRSKCGIFHAS